MADDQEALVVMIRKVRPLLWEASIVRGRTVYSYHAMTEWGARRLAKRHERDMSDWY